MRADGEEEPVQGSSPSSRFERIFVSVRLRPLNEKEIARNDVFDWECINDNTIIYRNNLSVAERSMYPTAYTFDRVFSSDCSTRKVYEEAAKEVVLSVVSGISSSVFAYGQTSSGKTFTMSGITEYTMADIYDYIQKHKEREFILKFSAMEIYNESVRDLLITDATPLRLLDDPERGTVVEKLTEETLKDWSHLKELLSVCEAQRQIGETSLNETSSRSHQILRLTIQSSAREFLGNDPSSLTATVNFVDLAGSERASQALSAGTRLKEGCHINRSLLTLGTVIRKLSKGRNGHVPFRDSKLTRILQSSLGGNARTAIICTMSPARTHVEQSRNTLLFASCAKEVTTNAQVNIVVSDKVLVKHLQREILRLENELKSSGKTFTSSDSALMMREKDLRIQQLEKEVVELRLQRDLARAQVEDRQRGAENGSNDRPPIVYAGLDHQYPKLRVRSSWDFENLKTETQTLANPHSVDISVRSAETCQCSDGHSRSSSDENFQILDLEKDFLHTKSDEEDEVCVPSFIGSDLLEEIEEEIEEHNDENMEDLYNYKDVRCIQLKESTNRGVDSNNESSLKRDGDLDTPSADVNIGTSGLMETENEGGQSGELRSPNLEKHKEWKKILFNSVTPTTIETSLWLPEKDLSCGPTTTTSLQLTRSKSCKASLTTSLASYQFENNEKTPPVLFEKDFTGRPGGLKKRISLFKFAIDREDLSTNESQTSAASNAMDELKSQNVETSDYAESTSCSTSFAHLEETTDPQDENRPADHGDTQPKSLAVPAKSVRDVGLDPIQHWEWPFEFKRLQREIIELWHGCNISLVHRTYFFLLFKGDHKDSIYMEVEHRRLTFLKNAFLRGHRAIEDGRTVSPASSMKALRQERHMLSQQLKKKFTKEQRQNLFLKWGIGLQTKHRGWQLAHLLWTETKDLNHVAESAAIVSKLVTFVKPEQAFKEMFGLSFAPRRRSNKKINLWKRSVMSIL